MKTIPEYLNYINTQLGLALSTQDKKFTRRNKKVYFNIELSKSVSESVVCAKLENLALSQGKIEVQPNGYKRIAIIINK